MSDYSAETPVCLFIYNRPEHTSRVVDTIANASPPLMLVIADGPASDADKDLCERTRAEITDRDFDFEVRTNFASFNLGLPERFTTGLNWVFEQVTEAIILEDDIVPTQSFFQYCDILLDHFREDERVMEITGRNQLGRWKRSEYDYHFSHYGGIWGWATWRDAWKEYDQRMELWDQDIVRDRIRDVLADDSQYRYVERVYDKTKQGEISSWGYRWGFARNRNHGLSAVPAKNLIKNIGFGEGATNTTNTAHKFANKETYEMSFPLTHPPFVAPDREYDRRFHELRQTRSKPRRILDALLDTAGIKKL